MLFNPNPRASSRTGGRVTGRPGTPLQRLVGSILDLTTHVGKEANQLEEVEAGIEHDSDGVGTVYADPQRDPWRAAVLPALKHIPAKRLVEETGLAMSTVKAARNGQTTPYAGNREALSNAAASFAREQLRERGVEPPADDLTACAAFLISQSGLQCR